MAKGNVGFYGKLPIVGDFITRRLPKDFVNVLDQWMQNGVSVSQEELGDNWLDLYLTSPIWRFAIQADICGEHAWVGIMMPSVDKVGRYYPLIVACPVDESQLALILAHCDDWFIRLEQLALAGLEENYSLEGFNEAILELETPQISNACKTEVKDNNDQLASHLISELEFSETVAMIDGVMLTGLNAINKSGENYSLWLHGGSEHNAGTVKIYKGLPTAHDYSVMIA